MEARVASVVLAVVVAVAAAPRGVRGNEPRSEDDATRQSRVWFEAGRAAYRAGDFATAITDFEKGYELKPLPLYLFNIGKAASNAGLKRKALQFFRDYIARQPDSTEAEEARQRVRELADELGEPAAAPSPSPPAVAAPVAPASPPTTTAIAAAPPTRRRPARDVAGWMLVAGGVAVAAAGAAWWGVANAEARAANGATTLQQYEDVRAAVAARQAAGIVCVAVGGALVVGGVIRFAVVGRRR